MDFHPAWTQNIAQNVEKVSVFVLRRGPTAVTLQFMKQFTRRQSVVLNITSAFKRALVSSKLKKIVLGKVHTWFNQLFTT